MMRRDYGSAIIAVKRENALRSTGLGLWKPCEVTSASEDIGLALR